MNSLRHKQEGSSSGNLSDSSRFGNGCIQAEPLTRAEAQQELEESERRYREIFENAKDAIYVHDLNGRYTLVNKAAEELIGYSRAELLRMSIFDVVPPEHIEIIRNSVNQKLADEIPTTYEVEAIRKDGCRVPVEVSSRLIYRDGKPIGVQGTARDISERKRAEEALRDSEVRFRTVTETASDAIIVIDEGGQISMVNPAAEKIFGYRAEEMNGQNVSMLIPEDFRAAHQTGLRRYLRTGQRSTSRSAKELPGLHRDGWEIPLEISFGEFTKSGQRFVTGIARDVTERKQSQEILKASEERFRELVENANDIIFTCDMSGNFTSFNRVGQRATGYSAEEIVRMNLTHVVAPNDIEKAQQMLSRKRVADVATVYELEIVTKSGERVTVEVSSRAIMKGGRPVGVQGIARDVTDRKRMESDLRASQAQLQQSQRLEAVGQLAGGVAHDFNNLLTAIIGYSDLSLRGLGAENPVRRNINEIKKAAGRAASLTRQLLAFSRKQILEPEVLDLNHVVRDMREMLRRLIGEDIHLATTLSSEVGRVKADPGQVEQIIMNLAVNARDAMPRGGTVTIETANVDLDDDYAREHQPTKPGQYVMLAVSDTGMGIDKETQARIFEPFFTTKAIGKGTGLGLSTVYGIVKQSGGFIWVSSELNVGTSFKVFLPRLKQNASLKSEISAPNVPAGSGTILLVEDDVMVRELIAESLRLAGYEVLESVNGNEALSIAHNYEDEIHLLITDVVMPVMGGRELAARLAGLRPNMRVLFISGYTNDAIVRHGIMDKDLEFLQKPFTPESLAQKVTEVLKTVVGERSPDENE